MRVAFQVARGIDLSRLLQATEPGRIPCARGTKVHGTPRLALFLALLATSVPAPARADEALSLVPALVGNACPDRGLLSAEERERVGALAAQPAEPLMVRGRTVGQRQRLVLPGGGEYLLERMAPGERLRQVRVTYSEPWGDGVRPVLLALGDSHCRLRAGRRLIYGDGRLPVAIERLDASLHEVEVREPLDPPVPLGEDYPGATVAVVDSGVNYLLPNVRRRLARYGDGRSLGYDFWDLDARPFDANPAASPFFPQRHGTQTASVLLEEAPVARLLPYRYPRPDMRRMVALIERAAAAGAVIVNISMGSRRRADWEPFAAAASKRPEMLFVVSAGNDGLDLDEDPVYPAALELENMIAVTSALDDGGLAPRSNWGRRSVDLAVPAEALVGFEFHGRPKLLSGSSYAAARLSAVAACLLAEHPSWRASELKAALFERAKPPAGSTDAYVSQGVILHPTASPRGQCPATEGPVTVSSVTALELPNRVDDGSVPTPTYTLSPTLIVLAGAGWDFDTVRRTATEAASILAQCGLSMPAVDVQTIDAPRRHRYFHERSASKLLDALPVPRPAVFFVADTLQATPFDAEAIGRANSRGRKALMNTVWITAGIEHPGISLAHELVHVLADSGRHDPDPDNLMHEVTNGRNTRLRDGQCMRIVRVGRAFELLTPRQ